MAHTNATYLRMSIVLWYRFAPHGNDDAASRPAIIMPSSLPHNAQKLTDTFV
jgi:hypothetical protein